jgi:hypothetical protein
MAADSPPDVRLGPFALWIHRYETPGEDGEEDANGLYVTARCAGQGAEVAITGPLLAAADLEQWLRECAELQRRPEGEASLEPVEPNLVVRLTGGGLGRIEGEVEITPDPLFQQHSFRFQLDPSSLQALIQQLATVCRRYPVIRGGGPVT